MIELGWVAPGDGGQALALLPLSLYDLWGITGTSDIQRMRELLALGG